MAINWIAMATKADPQALTTDEAAVMEALETAPEGMLVKALSVEVDIPEHKVRTVLIALEGARLVRRTKGEASKPGEKRPYLWHKVLNEEEVLTMPDITPGAGSSTLDEALEREEGAEDQGQGEDGQGEDEGGGFPQMPEMPRTPAPPAPGTKLDNPARGVLSTVQKREVNAAEQETALRTGHKTGGTRRVERVEPTLPGFPPEEMGLVGGAFELSVVGGLEDYIKATFGGGSFIVHPCDNTGNIYQGKRQQVNIGGLPRCFTPAGKAWLERYEGRFANPDEEGGSKKKGNKDLSTLEMIQLINDASTKGQNQLLGMLQAMKPAAEPAANAEVVKQAHALEIQRIQTDANARVEDIRRTLKDQVERLEKDLKETKETAKKDLESLEARLTREHDREVKQTVDTWTERVKAAEAKAVTEIEFAKKMATLEIAVKEAKASPKDIGTQVQLAMIPDMAKVMIDKMKNDLLGKEDAEEGWTDVFKEIAKEKGPEVLQAVLNAVNKVSNKPAEPAGAAPRRPGLPGPTRPGNPPAIPAKPARSGGAPMGTTPDLVAKPAATAGVPVVLVPPEALAAPVPPVPEAFAGETPPEAPAGLEVVDRAMAATEARLDAFFETVHTEWKVDADPEVVWQSPMAGGGTLDDLWGFLPGKIRRSVEEVKPEQAWESLIDALALAPGAHPLVDEMNAGMAADPARRKWVDDFFAAGPWTETDDETEEEEEEGEEEEEAPE